MNNFNMAKAMQIIDRSRQERLNKIVEILSDLPDDFDWNELESITSEQLRNSDRSES